MKNKITLLILVLVFAVLLAGAYLLYDRLGQEAAPDQLAVLQTQPTTEAPTRETAAPTQTTVPTQTTAPETTVPETTAQVLPMAPDFTVYDLEGQPVKLSDFLGKPVVLNFWASWCGPCKMEMPDFQEKYRELGESVQFLMVNMTDGSRETVDTASAFIAQQGFTFPVLYDTAYEAAYTYGVYSLPTTYFIDAQGYAIAQATGAIDAATVQRGIDMITDIGS